MEWYHGRSLQKSRAYVHCEKKKTCIRSLRENRACTRTVAKTTQSLSLLFFTVFLIKLKLIYKCRKVEIWRDRLRNKTGFNYTVGDNKLWTSCSAIASLLSNWIKLQTDSRWWHTRRDVFNANVIGWKIKQKLGDCEWWDAALAHTCCYVTSADLRLVETMQRVLPAALVSRRSLATSSWR